MQYFYVRARTLGSCNIFYVRARTYNLCNISTFELERKTYAIFLRSSSNLEILCNTSTFELERRNIMQHFYVRAGAKKLLCRLSYGVALFPLILVFHIHTPHFFAVCRCTYLFLCSSRSFLLFLPRSLRPALIAKLFPPCGVI